MEYCNYEKQCKYKESLCPEHPDGDKKCKKSDWCPHQEYIQDNNERSSEPSDRILSSNEIDCFNDYLESEKVDIAFGNTDWCHIYLKIVGNQVSEYARERMNSYRES